jgi:S1-C subfamily serine protease
VLFGTVPAFDYQGKGVKIDSLVTDSPAAQAGLKPGDVLVRIDGKPIEDLRAFSDILKTLKPNQQVKAVVQRQGQETTVNVTVRER